jgi:hypothetical protein
LLVSVALVSGAGFAVASATSALATTTCTATWTGAGSNNAWTTPANWSPQSVPGPTDNVCVDVGTTLPLITSDVTISNLEVSQGDVIVDEPGSLTVTNAVTSTAAIALNGATLTAGSIDISGQGNIAGSQDTSTIDSAAFQLQGGNASVISQNGTLTFTHAPLNLTNNTLSGGVWIAQSSGVIQMPGDIHTLDAALILSGAGPSYFVDASNANAVGSLTKITANGGLGIGSGASLTTTAPLQALGNISFTGSSAALTSGALTASGEVNMDSGAGVITAPTVTLTKTGQLSGAVKIKGNLVNNGKLQTGSPLADAAAGGHVFTQVMGRYTQTSTGHFAPTIIDNVVRTLQVSGVATLNGGLTFNGTGPVGTSFTLLTAASRTGKFTSFTFGSPPAYTATSVRAVVTPQIQVPATIVHGKTFPVGGVQFPATRKVTFYLDKVAGAGIGSVTTQPDGSFFTVLVMPAATSRKAHTFIAVAAGGSPKVSKKITVK